MIFHDVDYEFFNFLFYFQISMTSTCSSVKIPGGPGSVLAGALMASSCSNMTPKELSDYDDIGTAVIADPYLGFGTHKMNLRFRSPRQVHQNYFKSVVTNFLKHQDYEKVYTQLLGSEWFVSMTRRRSKIWQKGLKEHVSSVLYFQWPWFAFLTPKVRKITVTYDQKKSFPPHRVKNETVLNDII